MCAESPQKLQAWVNEMGEWRSCRCMASEGFSPCHCGKKAQAEGTLLGSIVPRTCPPVLLCCPLLAQA